MAKGLRLINERLPFVDAIIEVRDARLPLSSINPLLEGFVVDERTPLSEKPRLVVYNKRDLAEKRLEQVRSRP
jgi:ribosome biogenesis GTPase A